MYIIQYKFAGKWENWSEELETTDDVKDEMLKLLDSGCSSKMLRVVKLIDIRIHTEFDVDVYDDESEEVIQRITKMTAYDYSGEVR